MKRNFHFHRALALVVFFVLLAIPASGGLTAPGDPILQLKAPQAVQGYHLGPERLLSEPYSPTDPDRYHPESAYNYHRDQFLVVWHNFNSSGNDREVIGRWVDGSGKPIGPSFTISSGTNDRLQPVVAYNGTNDEYLVVFMYDHNGDEQKYDVRARRVRWDGFLLGSEFEVQTYENGSFWSPEVAWNDLRNEYMIVWTTLTQTTQVADNIGMKIFGSTGNYIYGTVLTSEGFPTNPDITYDLVTNNYLVLWNFLNASGKLAIRGDLRDSLGNRIRLVDVFGSNTNHGLYPRITSSMGLLYVATFEYEIAANNHDIYVALIASDGTVSIPTPLVEGTTHDIDPDIAGSFRSFEYMIVYQRADGMGTKVLMRTFSSNLPVEDVTICDYFSTNCQDPSVMFGGSGFLMSYSIEDPIQVQAQFALPQPPGPVRHIYDRMFHSSVIFIPVAFKN
jgi:hypothetical protein